MSDTLVDPVQSAKAAGLRYTNDNQPGIRRQRVGKGFSYFDVEGSRIPSSPERDRIKALAIPPAWTDVWICPYPQGHLQATGRDAKGRKQYRYHPEWRRLRNQVKFDRLLPFGHALPTLRQQTAAHLQLSGMPREKVLATVVQLLEKTLIRVGNDEYARRNQSFGLTTLRDRHVDVDHSQITFEFRGKSGVEHAISIEDQRLANIIRKCQDIPGYELFQYIDADQQRQTIDSGDVNDYLQWMTGADFTAKDFRTWKGTVLAASNLIEVHDFTSQKQAEQYVREMIKAVAQQLGNRPATCRKYYIHPGIIDTYIEEKLATLMQQKLSDLSHLSAAEKGVLSVLQHIASV
ncbi:DNA topoisomerase IB [Acaryochloris sp. CCMEE 5410]|uniref:DNA topoisomerase IB n=1 Tax=Acaryochloris sp. CCMEE 5410 TaxID=310037 RepID=UPI0002484ED8|nr:DNA topoisomerase IB [Acaryochloris sp. CCMEE 5410]